jgi:hypothetical protein
VLLVAAAVLLVVVGLALVHNSGRDPARTARPANDGAVSVSAAEPGDSSAPHARPGASPSPTSGDTVVAGVSTAAPAVAPTAAVPATPGPRVTSAAPRPVGPALQLARTRVDLGPVDSSDAIQLTSAGTTAVDVRVGALPSWLTAVPRSSQIGPGATTDLVITLDRAAAPTGPLDVPVAVSPARGSGGATVRVTATIADGPRILAVTAAPASLRTEPCTAEGAATTAALTVRVQDATGMFGVGLVVRKADGQTSTTALELGPADGDQSTWTGALGPSASAGSLTYTVRATDLDRRTAEVSGSVTVVACP